MGAAALIDSPGGTAVQYRYDAWGRPLSKTGTLASTLGTYNPFCYRHYVYDEETGLYDLRSRYDNPVWGRFICADGQINSNSTIIALNLFAYCANNPIVYTDENGYDFRVVGVGVQLVAPGWRSLPAVAPWQTPTYAGSPAGPSVFFACLPAIHMLYFLHTFV